MRFTPQFLDELKARLPVSEVVGRRVKLVEADLRHHCYPRQYDLWHDRASFISWSPSVTATLSCRRSFAPCGRAAIWSSPPSAPLAQPAVPLDPLAAQPRKANAAARVTIRWCPGRPTRLPLPNRKPGVWLSRVAPDESRQPLRSLRRDDRSAGHCDTELINPFASSAMLS